MKGFGRCGLTSTARHFIAQLDRIARAEDPGLVGLQSMHVHKGAVHRVLVRDGHLLVPRFVGVKLDFGVLARDDWAIEEGVVLGTL